MSTSSYYEFNKIIKPIICTYKKKKVIVFLKIDALNFQKTSSILKQYNNPLYKVGSLRGKK